MGYILLVDSTTLLAGLGILAYLSLSTYISYYALHHSTVLNFSWPTFIQLALIMPFFTPTLLIVGLMERISRLRGVKPDEDSYFQVALGISAAFLIMAIEYMSMRA